MTYLHCWQMPRLAEKYIYGFLLSTLLPLGTSLAGQMIWKLCNLFICLDLKTIDTYFLSARHQKCQTQSYWTPLYVEAISLSLSHLVPEIIGPKVDLTFHPNLSFDSFISIYSLNFDPVDLPFILKSFWLIFRKP